MKRWAPLHPCCFCIDIKNSALSHLPKTTCLPSSHGVFSVQRKNYNDNGGNRLTIEMTMMMTTILAVMNTNRVQSNMVQSANNPSITQASNYLTAIGIRTSISHWKNSWCRMLEPGQLELGLHLWLVVTGMAWKAQEWWMRVTHHTVSSSTLYYLNHTCSQLT